MATLQKFKLLATHCAVAAGSPTRSPSATPVGHLRHRRTLRKLLRCRRDDHPDRPIPPPNPPSAAASTVRLKLKDFLLSSPTPPPRKSAERRSERAGSGRSRVSPTRSNGGGAAAVPRGGSRAFTATLRQRLLRKSWRPVLVSIPE